MSFHPFIFFFSRNFFLLSVCDRFAAHCRAHCVRAPQGVQQRGSGDQRGRWCPSLLFFSVSFSVSVDEPSSVSFLSVCVSLSLYPSLSLSFCSFFSPLPLPSAILRRPLRWAAFLARGPLPSIFHRLSAFSGLCSRSPAYAARTSATAFASASDMMLRRERKKKAHREAAEEERGRKVERCATVERDGGSRGGCSKGRAEDESGCRCGRCALPDLSARERERKEERTSRLE